MRDTLLELSSRRLTAMRDKATQELSRLEMARSALANAQILCLAIPMGSFHQEAEKLLDKKSVIARMAYLEALTLFSQSSQLKSSVFSEALRTLNQESKNQHSLIKTTEQQLQDLRTSYDCKMNEARKEFDAKAHEAARIKNEVNPSSPEFGALGCLIWPALFGVFMAILWVLILLGNIKGPNGPTPADNIGCLFTGLFLCSPAVIYTAFKYLSWKQTCASIRSEANQRGSDTHANARLIFEDAKQKLSNHFSYQEKALGFHLQKNKEYHTKLREALRVVQEGQLATR